MKKQLLFLAATLTLLSFNANAQVPCNTTADCPQGNVCCESDSTEYQGVCQESC